MFGITVWGKPEPPFYRQPPPLYTQPLFFIFFVNSPFLTTLFPQYRLNEIPNKHDELICHSYIFIFRRLKNNVICFLHKHHFYKQHQTQIWSVIITISSFPNLSYPVIRKSTYAYQGVRNFSFSENFGYAVNEYSL